MQRWLRFTCGIVFLSAALSRLCAQAPNEPVEIEAGVLNSLLTIGWSTIDTR